MWAADITGIEMYQFAESSISPKKKFIHWLWVFLWIFKVVSNQFLRFDCRGHIFLVSYNHHSLRIYNPELLNFFGLKTLDFLDCNKLSKFEANHSIQKFFFFSNDIRVSIFVFKRVGKLTERFFCEHAVTNVLLSNSHRKNLHEDFIRSLNRILLNIFDRFLASLSILGQKGHHCFDFTKQY